MPSYSSRKRFEEYMQEVADRRLGKPKDESSESPKKAQRQRTFGNCFSLFGSRSVITKAKLPSLSLTLTIATLLGLIPPAGTKLAIDYVLTDPPLPCQVG